MNKLGILPWVIIISLFLAENGVRRANTIFLSI